MQDGKFQLAWMIKQETGTKVPSSSDMEGHELDAPGYDSSELVVESQDQGMTQ